jgi:hypothetical protein
MTTPHDMFRFALLALTLLGAIPAAAQVPASAEAVIWRGFELDWGTWSHRLGPLASHVAPLPPGGDTAAVHERIEAGSFRDPGGVRMQTHVTRFVVPSEAPIRFWHLAGHELELSGRFHCGESADVGGGVFVGEMVLGGSPPAGRGFDPTRVDPHGELPVDFDQVMVLLNGIELTPGQPNGAHTLDSIEVAITGPPRVHGAVVRIPLRVEYLPGCVPDVLHTCSNPFEGPGGAERWSALVRPYFLVIGHDDDAANVVVEHGRLADESAEHHCGDEQRFALAESRPLAAGDGAALLGFTRWGASAGAPGPGYERDRPRRSCEHCAVALTGRHLRQFGLWFNANPAGNMRAAIRVDARWRSDPFDGNPYVLFGSNPHWPAFDWTIAGISTTGEAHELALVASETPAISLRSSLALNDPTTAGSPARQE